MTTSTVSKIRSGEEYPSDGIDRSKPFVKLRGYDAWGAKFGVLLQDETAVEVVEAKTELRARGVVSPIEELYCPGPWS